jgi:hypothetical protein
MDTVKDALLFLDSREIDYITASSYGEPGYGTDKDIIILANWNELSREDVNAIEKVAEIEWSDEWIVDDDDRAFRTQGDCYHWQPSCIITDDGDVVGADKMLADPVMLREWINFEYVGKKRKALSSAVITREALERAGCKLLVDKRENGWHQHMTDNPDAVLAEVKPTGNWFFRISDVSQFYIVFELWQMPEAEEE